MNIVGVAVRVSNDFDWEIDVYRSTDGGATWDSPQRVDNIIEEEHLGGVDPTVAFDANGILYVSYQHAYASALVVLKSTDGGRTSPQIRTNIIANLTIRR